MSEFKSFSQAGQDRFAYELIGDSGTFLDIGANHPIERNNTYGLELIGWRGLLVDMDNYCVELCRSQRKNYTLHADSAAIEWDSVLSDFKLPIDYVSLDVDIASAPTLAWLIKSGVTFRVLTIEHDKYRFGDWPQQVMRKVLGDAGYKLICSDVCDNGMPFEDWWVCPELEHKTALLKSNNVDWKEIFPHEHK